MKRPVPSLSHSRVRPPSFVMLLPGPQSASTRSRSPSPSTSPGSRSPTLSGICRQVRRGDFAERAPPGAEEQPALRLVGRADDDVGEAVAVEVARLDHAREVRRGAEHLRGRLGEAEARAGVEEHLVRLRRAGRGVVAAVGEQQVGPAVAVEVGDLDLVGPVPASAPIASAVTSNHKRPAGALARRVPRRRARTEVPGQCRPRRRTRPDWMRESGSRAQSIRFGAPHQGGGGHVRAEPAP